MLRVITRRVPKNTISFLCKTQRTNAFNKYTACIRYATNAQHITREYEGKLSPKSAYTTRTCTCGELNILHVGLKVTLCGWLEYQRLNKFVVLRDGYGQTQLLCDEKNSGLSAQISKIPFETVIEVEGEVVARPLNMVNKKQATGEVEVLIHSLKVLNLAKEDLPFNIREFQKAKEALRMQYRYLDMRFVEMQRNMRVRSDILMDMRYFLCKRAQFVDVETPTLFKATPGGAQEFVVPTRYPGLFYSLVQSPQQFKQMLMAGAIDRYFQIARCYRDEGSRPDRQPEFTQLDLEMSFTNTEGIQTLVEDLLNFSWPQFLPNIPTKFPKMTFDEAMENYGTDKPDTRFEFRLGNYTNIFKTQANLTQGTKDFGAYYLKFEAPCDILTNKQKDELANLSKKYTCKFLQMKVPDKNAFIEKTTKLFGCDFSGILWEQLHLSKDNVLFLAFGERNNVLSLLGKVRLEYVNNLQEKGVDVIKETMNMLWITDFPLFEQDENGKLCTMHHPFTAPQTTDLDLLEIDPLGVKAQAYDLVLNGNEIGGGSIRIHDSVLQEKVLKMLGIDTHFMQHMLDMLKSGCPPHGGIALGLDRLMAIVLNTPSIRDVIAFPKTAEGRDPISGAPSKISEEEKKLYHIETKA